MIQYDFNSLNVGVSWLRLLSALVTAGERAKPRGLACREIPAVCFHAHDMRQNILVHPRRKLNYRFMVAEWLWIALGREDLAPLARYNGELVRFSDDGLRLAGAYGPRLYSQWAGVLHKLRDDPDTRRAVASIWTANPAASKDIPCTLSLQFMLRHGDINCVATMRSSDAWLGLPYDFFTFSMLTSALAGELGVTPGWLRINMGSSHLYEEHLEQARAVLQEPYAVEALRSPSLPGRPVNGLNYILEERHARPDLLDPWKSYGSCLQLNTSADALEVLRALSPARA